MLAAPRSGSKAAPGKSPTLCSEAHSATVRKREGRAYSSRQRTALPLPIWSKAAKIGDFRQAPERCRSPHFGIHAARALLSGGWVLLKGSPERTGGLPEER